MNSLRKDYESFASFSKDVEALSQHGGLLLQAAENVDARSAAKVELAVAGKVVAEVEGEVVYCSPGEKGFQVGVELRGDWAERVKKAQKLAITPDKWGRDSKSIYHDVSGMTTPQKIQLALKGNKSERRVLLKDNHYMVHPYVLKNPKIAPDEIAQIAKMSTITSEMILTISNNTEWMNKTTVRTSIVKSPKTPLHIVQKHIEKVPEHDLIRIAKSEGVRDGVQKMAKRILAKRGKVIR